RGAAAAAVARGRREAARRPAPGRANEGVRAVGGLGGAQTGSAVMPQHIGIVACSAEGAALCYRTICLEGTELLGPHDHPEVSMHTHSLAEYVKFMNRNDWAGVAQLMMSSAEKLARAGADFLICPDNTIHQAFDLVEHRSPLPWLHIAREVAREARHRQFKRLAVLGTRDLMEGPVYPEALEQAGIEFRVPGREQRERTNEIIF